MRSILEIFNISKVGKIAGCRVTDGTVERGANVRLIRDNVVIHEGKLSQLKRFKDDAREVRRRTGMRHGVRELPGHAGRRRHRVLPGRDGAAVAVAGGVNGTWIRPPPPAHLHRWVRHGAAAKRSHVSGRAGDRADRTSIIESWDDGLDVANRLARTGQASAGGYQRQHGTSPTNAWPPGFARPSAKIAANQRLLDEIVKGNP